MSLTSLIAKRIPQDRHVTGITKMGYALKTAGCLKF
jgi:hypothetical protein